MALLPQSIAHWTPAGRVAFQRRGSPHEINLRRGQDVSLVDEVAEHAHQFQCFGGEGAGGLDGAGVFFAQGVEVGG
jgi:hypothetical protein